MSALCQKQTFCAALKNVGLPSRRRQPSLGAPVYAKLSNSSNVFDASGANIPASHTSANLKALRNVETSSRSNRELNSARPKITARTIGISDHVEHVRFTPKKRTLMSRAVMS